jgi:hypothetical protein
VPTILAISATPRAHGNSEVLLDKRIFQDRCRPLGIELVGWVHADCLRPGEVVHKPEVLEHARALGPRLAEKA